MRKHDLFFRLNWPYIRSEIWRRRSSRPEVFCKKEACNFIKKETLAQVFSCEFSEISKNTFFYRAPLVAASGGDHLVLACSAHLTICQKLPPEVFCKKRCSKKFCKIHKKTPEPEPLF